MLATSMVVGISGPLLDLPQAVLDAAPSGLVPAVPAVPLEPAPLVGMALVALVLTAAGAAAFRRRDLVASGPERVVHERAGACGQRSGRW